jgi:outer membrane protein OmpA-like peptidoglycan-associated protein
MANRRGKQTGDQPTTVTPADVAEVIPRFNASNEAHKDRLTGCITDRARLSPRTMEQNPPSMKRGAKESDAGYRVAGECAPSTSRLGRSPGKARTAVAAVLTGAACCLPLAGCQSPPSSREVVVLLASATRNEPDPELASPDLASLRRDAGRSSDAVAYVVNPSTGQAAKVPLTPRRPDGQVDWGPDRGGRIAANLREVALLLGRQAAYTPFDLLSDIAEAVRVSPVPGTLIVDSSGLSTAGAFDLRYVGWMANPRMIALKLLRGGFLPDLAGWHVVFSNVGVTAAPQPALPQPQRTKLASYWLAICHTAGAASCATDLVTRPDPPSRSVTPVPVVHVPAITSVQGPHGLRGKVVPADLLFAFNSARLLPGADVILRPMARQAVSRHLMVFIRGYSSPDGGSAAYNLALSLRRARSIRSRLVALGVPATAVVQTRGYGTADKSPAACYRHGRLDESICSRLRKVVILFSPVDHTRS